MTKPRAESASQVFALRLSPEESRALRDAAAIAGKPPSTFARDMIACGLWHWQPTKETAPPPPKRRQRGGAARL